MSAAQQIADHRVWGRGDFTVFLLHGGYGSAEYWMPEVPYLLEAGYRVVAWDAPGYGLSPLPEGEYTIESLARACADLVEAVGSPGQKNVLLGHSMGGLIAPKTCELVHERIAALVISATVESLGHTEPEFQEQFVAERVAPLDAGKTLREAAPALIELMMGPTSRGEGVDLVKRVTALTRDATFREAIRAIVEYDGRPAIAGLDLPTLCIAGEHDPVGRPEMMRTLAAGIQGAQFHMVKGAGHYAWAENPDEFNSVVFAFLDKALSA